MNDKKSKENDGLIVEIVVAMLILFSFAIVVSVPTQSVVNAADDVSPSSEDYYEYEKKVVSNLGVIIGKHYENDLLFDDYILIYENNGEKLTKKVSRSTYLSHDKGDILSETSYEYYDSHVVDSYEDNSSYIVILDTENYGTLALSVPEKHFEYVQENNEYSINKVNTEPDVKVIDLPDKYKE